MTASTDCRSSSDGGCDMVVTPSSPLVVTDFRSTSKTIDGTVPNENGPIKPRTTYVVGVAAEESVSSSSSASVTATGTESAAATDTASCRHHHCPQHEIANTATSSASRTRVFDLSAMQEEVEAMGRCDTGDNTSSMGALAASEAQCLSDVGTMDACDRPAHSAAAVSARPPPPPPHHHHGCLVHSPSSSASLLSASLVPPPPLESLTTCSAADYDDDDGSVSSVSTLGTVNSQSSSAAASAVRRRSVFSKYWVKTGQEPMKWQPQAPPPQVLSTAPEHEAVLDEDIPSPPTHLSSATSLTFLSCNSERSQGSTGTSTSTISSYSRRSNILHPGTRRLFSSTPSLPSYHLAAAAAVGASVETLPTSLSRPFNQGRKVRSESFLLMSTSGSSSSLMSMASTGSSSGHVPHRRPSASCLRREARYSQHQSQSQSQSPVQPLSPSSSPCPMTAADETVAAETTDATVATSDGDGNNNDVLKTRTDDDGVEHDEAVDGRWTSFKVDGNSTIARRLKETPSQSSLQQQQYMHDCGASVASTTTLGTVGSVRFDIEGSTVVTFQPPQERYAEEGWSDYFQV